MKIVVTGGHPSPAFAVIERLFKKAEIILIGRKYTFEKDKTLSFEYELAKELKIPFENITTGRLQRKFTNQTIFSLLRIPQGLFQAMFLLRKYKPDLVLTFGGSVGLVVGVAAFLMGIPIVLHEQTQKVGLANKIISYFASRVCISFAKSSKYFPKEKTVLTGNPLRREVFQIKGKLTLPKNFGVIYITGGSAGSHFINSLIKPIVNQLLEKYVLIHQAGDSKTYRDYNDLLNLKKSLPGNLRERYILKRFILPKELGLVFKKADLVIGRAGINTVCELLSWAKMCLLIPLPHGQFGEQLENAVLVKKAGIGEYIKQEDVDSSSLFEKINLMFKNKNSYKASENTKEFQMIGAVENLIEVIKSVYESSVKKAV